MTANDIVQKGICPACKSDNSILELGIPDPGPLKVPIVLICSNCHAEFTPSAWKQSRNPRCFDCGGSGGEMLRQDEHDDEGILKPCGTCDGSGVWPEPTLRTTPEGYPVKPATTPQPPPASPVRDASTNEAIARRLLPDILTWLRNRKDPSTHMDQLLGDIDDIGHHGEVDEDGCERRDPSIQIVEDLTIALNGQGSEAFDGFMIAMDLYAECRWSVDAALVAILDKTKEPLP